MAGGPGQAVAAAQAARGFHQASPVQLLEQLADRRPGQVALTRHVGSGTRLGALAGQRSEDDRGVVGKLADADQGVGLGGEGYRTILVLYGPPVIRERDVVAPRSGLPRLVGHPNMRFPHARPIPKDLNEQFRAAGRKDP